MTWIEGKGLLSFIWALWLCVAMGNMDGEMDSKGNACVQTLPDTNSVSVLLNHGIIIPSVPYYQGLEGVGEWGWGWGGLVGADPAFQYPILFFITFSLPRAPPTGLGAG